MTSTAEKEAPAPPAAVDRKQTFQFVAIARLRESKWNPRRTFADGPLKDLTESIRSKGIIVPLLVRTSGKSLEIIAGARRFRAAKLAGLEEVPVIIRDLSDEQVLEAMVIENLQRADLHPLDEAEGYQRLHTEFKHSIDDIAARVGKSKAYVYARLKLCELTKDAKKAFAEDRITAAHAVLLARLKPEDQARALDPEEMALLEEEHTLFSDEPEVKARSVREFEDWIKRNVRFDVEQVDQMVFPETAAAVTEAKTEEAKVLAITSEHFVPPEAREGRTLGPRSWKRADGKERSKTCEYSELGVVVVGAGQGESFKVCTKKDTCKVHWAAEQREKAKRAKRAASGQAVAAKDRYQKEEEKSQRRFELEQAERSRWEKARPEIAGAVASRVKRAPAKAKGLLAQIVLGAIFEDMEKATEGLVPLGSTAEDFVRHAAFRVLYGVLRSGWNAPREFPKFAKALGIDVRKILDEHAPLEKPVAKPSKR